MKWLNRKISVISKLVLLFNLLLGGVQAQELISSDRFVMKILDRAVSFQDINFHARNLKALNCIYADALVISYFGKNFITDLEKFTINLPTEEDEIKKYLHQHEDVLRKVRHFFKMLRYSEDQNKKVSTELSNLIKEGQKENNCSLEILHKESLKTNFKSLLEMELNLRSRYEAQLKSNKRNFEGIKSSIDLFLDSLDKQFIHEYYW
jgi:hypothetical protein